MRILEEAMGEMTDLRPRGLFAFDQCSVNVCTAVLYVADVALLFEDADGGQHRVVGQGRLAGKRFEHLLNGRWPLLPQYVHKPEFGFGQGYRFGWWQGLLRSHLLDALDARTSTNYLVAWGGVDGCLGDGKVRAIAFQ